MGMTELKHLELLSVIGEDGALYRGSDQHWYPKDGFIPQGGCGAATASNLLAYILRTRQDLFSIVEKTGLDGLAPPLPCKSPNTKDGYIEFMKKVYRFMYPRAGGLMADVFTFGITELAAEYSLPFTPLLLRVPIGRLKRPDFNHIAGFIQLSLETDMPVAFLILSKGNVKELDTWHWVTVIGLDEVGKSVEVLDNGVVVRANLETWLNTSIMGGSFVRLKV